MPDRGRIMSQTADEQIRRTLDALLERLRVSVADQVSTTAEQLSRSVEGLHREALESARREAAAAAERDVTARLNDVFARREEQVREAARAEWFEVGVGQGRAEAAASLAARDAEAQAAAEAAAKTTAALAASVETVVEARRDATRRLLQAFRAMDGTASLSQTLDALAASVKSEAGRFAILLPRANGLRVWSHSGFAALGEETAAEIPLPDAGVAADTMLEGRIHRIRVGQEGRPGFAAVPADEDRAVFVSVPLTMNGQVIAVVCGEDLDGEDGGDRLASVLEILARHGARVLESLTALRLAQLGSQPSSSAAVAQPQQARHAGR